MIRRNPTGDPTGQQRRSHRSSGKRRPIPNLKASGDYARIIGEMKNEIEREHREALKELQRVERAAQEVEEAERATPDLSNAHAVASRET